MNKTINKKSILVFYQHAVREIDACEQLMSLLESNEQVGKTALFQIDFEWSRAIKWAKRNGVDIILMPWLYHDDNYALLSPFFSINPKLIPINLHHEQVTSIMSEPLVLPASDAAKNGCCHFAWGEFFKDKLISCGVNPSLVTVTGNIRFDLIDKANKVNRKRELAGIYELDLNKKWILFPESRGWVYETNDVSMEEGIRQGVRREDYSTLKEVESKSLEVLYAQIKALSDGFLDKFEFIYRPHPGTHTPLADGDRIRVIAGRSIGEWLESSDLVVAWGSTVAYEAEIADVPFVRHEPVCNLDRFRPYGYERFPVIQDLAEIDSNLISSIRRQQRASPVYPDFYGEADGQSTQRMANAIINLMNNPPQLRTNFRLTDSHRMQRKRKVLYEHMTRISAMTGFLKLSHWPRSAYRQIRDIPY